MLHKDLPREANIFSLFFVGHLDNDDQVNLEEIDELLERVRSRLTKQQLPLMLSTQMNHQKYFAER